MIYHFGTFELDTAKAELRDAGQVRAVEPQVFTLLAVLIENRERLVSKDELLEKVWDGRVVSDSAISSRVKSARQAVGDDGRAQRAIKTIHSQGFRFVAEVRLEASAEPRLAADGDGELAVSAAETSPATTPLVERLGRPSIAVLPFVALGDMGPYATVAEALPHELITELARLRWLFVTARGSSFRLRQKDADISAVGQILGVRYCLTGTVQLEGRNLSVNVELADTLNGGVVWADGLTGHIDDVHAFRGAIRARILAELEIQIPLHEAAAARLAVTEDLDAWAAYHLGLQHMYRFNRVDNAAAKALFERAVAQDPAFGRAQAGLSFVHFQTAFMRYSDDVSVAIDQARRCAERALELDALDPFSNFAMGRTYWLVGDLDGGIAWLERSIQLSPNYAQGLYALAWTETLADHSSASRGHVDLAMQLSPLDPLYYAMLGTRALTHMAAGEDAEAGRWAERAGRSPGAHVLAGMIALVGNALAGNDARAAWWAANVRQRRPGIGRTDFLRAFPMQSAAMKDRISAALMRFGF